MRYLMFIILVVFTLNLKAQEQDSINIGLGPNTGTGDPYRVCWIKTNRNDRILFSKTDTTTNGKGISKFQVNQGMIGVAKNGADSIIMRKPMAADTVNLSATRIGDIFIDTSGGFWFSSRIGRGGWIKLN